MLKGRLGLFALVLLGLTAGACDSVDEGGVVRSDGSTGDGGVVSSAHELATLAGVEVLEEGGNAFDAAVAVAAALTVVEPMNSNLFGGYGTLLIFDAQLGALRYHDMNGRFPKATNADVFREADDLGAMLRTAQAVSTPANLRGFEALWQEYGTLPWPRLLSSARRYAADGVTVSGPVARAIPGVWADLSDYAKEIYGRDGRPLEEGDLIVQADLADAFDRTAELGSDALYDGPLGEMLVREMVRGGGFLTMEDLAEHEAEWFDPIEIDFRGHRVATAGAPSNAFAALVIAGIMSRYDNVTLGFNSTAYLHRFAEAAKHATWTRLKYAGGPEEDAPPLQRLLSDAYWQEAVDAVDPDVASDFVPPSQLRTEGGQTTHFVVADRWGNVVSATITLGDAFGSAVLVEGAGIWLNNSMAYSTFFPAGNPMDALPGRRKHSSMSPTIILRDGRPWAAFGTPGGHTI
ncbi:MAG: gamma-glutamyltransferase, partial [Chloroflexi bacterium]|nr:gamma-glutamyltransferase [Chloroflexota bacterium]